MDRLMSRAGQIIAATADDRQCLSDLVRDHIAVALLDRTVLMVYHRESHMLPADDRRRLRRRQRLYIEEWVHLLAPLRPDLADGELRLAVHAAIGAIQSTLFFRSGLAPGRLEELLDAMAHGCSLPSGWRTCWTAWPMAAWASTPPPAAPLPCLSHERQPGVSIAT